MGFSVIDRWYLRLQPKTVKVSGWLINGFMKWLKDNGGQFSGMTPDELVAWQRAHPGSYEIVDILQNYLIQKPGRVKYKARIQSCVYSLFMHNRAPLPRDPHFLIRGTKPAVMGKLTVDEVRHILDSCNELFRAVFLCMCQGFMGVEELLYFDANGYDSLIDQFEKHNRLIRVDLPGRKLRKNIEPYYTFLGRDAQATLRVWLDKRPLGCPKGHIFCTQHEEPLQYKTLQQYWYRHLDKLGLVKRLHNSDSSNRYGKGMHEIRDMMRTRWRLTNIDVQVAEYFMGHGLDVNQYDKSPRDNPEWFHEQYLTGESWLNIVTEDPERVPRAEVNKQLRELKETQDGELALIQRRLDQLERRGRV